MTNSIFQNADRIAALLMARGETVFGVSKSVNRFGGFSAYIDCGSIRYRVSDHACNTDFRVGESDIPQNADAAYFDDAARLADEMRALAAEKKAKALAERDAFEAPFIARFKEAKEHEQFGIVVEAYPDTHYNKAARREILARFRAA